MLDKYKLKRRVLIIIGDENVTGVEPYDANSEQTLAIPESAKIWNGNDFVKLDKYEVLNTNGLIRHLMLNLESYGVYILPITKNELKASKYEDSDITYTNLNKNILKYLIGPYDSESNPKGALVKVINKLKEVENESGVVEAPEFFAIVYSGSIRDAQEKEGYAVIEDYPREISKFISNIKTYFNENLVEKFQYSQSAFKFIDCACQISATKSIFLETGTSVEAENPILSNRETLLEVQKNINIPGYLLFSCPSATTFGIYKLSNEVVKNLTGKDSGVFKGYVSNRGIKVYKENCSGILYSQDDFSLVGKEMSYTIEDIFKWRSLFESLPIEYYNFSESFDYAYLFYTDKIVKINDFASFNPDKINFEYIQSGEATDKEREAYKATKKSFGFVYRKMDKLTDRVFSTDVEGDIYSKNPLKFTHLLFFNEAIPTDMDPNPDPVFVGYVKFYSTQEFFSKSKIRINIQREIINTNYSVAVQFNSEDISYYDHVYGANKSTYFMDDDVFGITEQGYNLGIISRSKTESLVKIENDLVRSDRITTNYQLSGDGLFLRNQSDDVSGLYRDRDNSSYSPYIWLPSNLSDDFDSDFCKIGFDAKLGVYVWEARFSESSSNVVINIYLTTGYKTILKYNIPFQTIEIAKKFQSEYQKKINKVVISIASGDLILNFGGKVYKAQVDSVNATNTEFNTTCGEIYKNSGYIIFPSWYDIWNLAYVINNYDVKIIDCSGEIHNFSDYKNFPHYAYVENFPGPKNTDHKNISAAYLVGGLVLRETLLQGYSKEDIAVYDCAIVCETNEYKYEVFPTSYKHKNKVSIRKAKMNPDGNGFTPFVTDFYICNQGFGEKKGKYWYYTRFNDNEKSQYFNERIENSDDGRIINARGVRILIKNKSLSLI